MRILASRTADGCDSRVAFTGDNLQARLIRTPQRFPERPPVGKAVQAAEGAFFKCPDCGHAGLDEKADHLRCGGCGKKWAIREGIYDFRYPLPDR